MFNIGRGTGFFITFANGVTVSVQCGTVNDCQRKSPLTDISNTPAWWESADAEVLIRHENKYLDPFGYVSPDQLAMILIICKMAGQREGLGVLEEILLEIRSEEVI